LNKQISPKLKKTKLLKITLTK